MNITIQTEDKFRYVDYGGNSVYNSACGCASMCNALRKAKIADVDLLDMCKFSLSVGARVPGQGTDMHVLMPEVAKKFDFNFTKSSSNAALVKHLKAGKVALINQGDEVPVFASGGHFVAGIGYDDDRLIIADSYWTTGKYTSTQLRRDRVKVIDRGLVSATIDTVGKATIDRNPSYWLITKKTKSCTTQTRVKARAGAGKDNAELARMEAGKLFRVKDETKNWVKVYAWIAKNNVSLTGTKAVSKTDAPLRLHSGKTSTLVGYAVKGAKFRVNKSTDNWLRVELWLPKKHAPVE